MNKSQAAHYCKLAAESDSALVHQFDLASMRSSMPFNANRCGDFPIADPCSEIYHDIGKMDSGRCHASGRTLATIFPILPLRDSNLSLLFSLRI
jgi:hypothetical protein